MKRVSRIRESWRDKHDPSPRALGYALVASVAVARSGWPALFGLQWIIPITQRVGSAPVNQSKVFRAQPAPPAALDVGLMLLRNRAPM